MKKRFTLILASMFLAMGAWAQTLADGIYTIQADENGKRGYLAATDADRPVLTEITWESYKNNGVAEVLENSKNWYVTTKDGVTYLYNVAKGQFIYDNGSDDIYFGDPFALNFTQHNSYIHVGSGTGTRYLSMGCGATAPNQVKWEKNNANDGGCLLTFTLVENGTTTFATQIAAADAAIEALLNASFSFSYISGENATNTWSEALSVYPAGLSNEVACGGGKGNSAAHIGADGHSVHKAVSAINAKGGDLTVTIQYATGLGNQNHAISTLGVDVVNANGEVVTSDYHLGFSGSSSFSNTYTLSGLAAGNYILRYYVCNKGGDHDLDYTSGFITVQGAEEITEAATVSDMLTTLKGEVPTAKGEGLGYYDTAETEAAEALANTEVTGDQVASYVAAFVALDDAIDGITFYTPTPGKFYRLQGKSSGNWMNAASNNTNIGMKSDKEEDPTATVFYLTENNKLLSFKLGTFLMNTHSIGAVGETNGNTVFFNPSESGNGGYFTLKTDYNGSQYVYDNSSKVDRNDVYKATNCEWKVEEVTYLPVAVSNTLKFGTLYSPVALSTTEQWSTGKIKAYTGTIKNDYLVLTEIVGDIPANTPVVVEYIGGDYKNGCAFLQIINDADAVEGDNDLHGGIATTAKTDNPYTLQSNDEGGVVFRKYTGDNLTGFKAYLDLPTEEAAAIGIRFEDGTTAIDNVQLSTDNVVIYDLMGRRVETMTEGNIYIVNGKKVVK